MHRNRILAAIVLAILSMRDIAAKAQDPGALPGRTAPQFSATYRLDFSVNELEEGKKINSRRYSMYLADDNTTKELKIGTRVPVQSGDGKFDYLDVGTSISARLITWKNPPILDVRAEISSFATPDETPRDGHPLLRQMQITGSTSLIPDKPTIIGSVDDPNSKRQFQLEVTATKLK